MSLPVSLPGGKSGRTRSRKIRVLPDSRVPGTSSGTGNEDVEQGGGIPPRWVLAGYPAVLYEIRPADHDDRYRARHSMHRHVSIIPAAPMTSRFAPIYWAARALGLTIPPTILALAVEVIE